MQTAGVEAGEGEHGAGERRHVDRLGHDVLYQSAVVGRHAVTAAQEHLGVGAQESQGCAQLVRGIGDE